MEMMVGAFLPTPPTKHTLPFSFEGPFDPWVYLEGWARRGSWKLMIPEEDRRRVEGQFRERLPGFPGIYLVFKGRLVK